MKAWFPILIPPLATLAHQSVNYALVALECEQQQRLPLHAVAAAALLISLTGVFVAWRDWSAAGAAAPQANGDPRSNARFLAIVGFSVSALMALAVSAMWLTAAFLSPCIR